MQSQKKKINPMKQEKTFKTAIRDLAPEDKPREKMMALGKKALSNAELIAILIGSGNTEQSAVELAQSILQHVDNDLNFLSRLTVKDLINNFKGIGEAKAISILSAIELGSRMQESTNTKAVSSIRSSNDLFKCIPNHMFELNCEEFWALYLNSRNNIIKREKIATGGLTDTIVDIRLIFKYALEYNAVRIAVTHNHPSGLLSPSKNDISLTQSIIEAGRTLRIPLMDHLIVGFDEEGKKNFFSFHDNGLA